MDATTLDQSEPGSNGNEGVLYIPQSSRTGASPSDVVYCHIQNTCWGVVGSYSSVEIQSAYSIAPANWAEFL